MVKIIFGLLLILSCSSFHEASQERKIANIRESMVVEGVVFSKLLNRPVNFWMIKPQGFFLSRLPVVYFLHGRGNDRYMFKNLNGEKLFQDYLSNGGRPFALVALSGTFEGKDTYWVNDARADEPQMRDVVIEEVIPEIEERYRLGGIQRKRAVAGISMGSNGAYQLALNSGFFKCVAGHSMVARPYESASVEFPGKFGSVSEFQDRDPVSLLRKFRTLQDLPFQRGWIDIGGQDVPLFLNRARVMANEFKRLGLASRRHNQIDIGRTHPHGKHDYPYWSSRLPEYLRWYGECF